VLAAPHPLSKAFKLIARRRSIAGSMIGDIPETQEMLDFCATYGIVTDIALIRVDQINDVYERMLPESIAVGPTCGLAGTLGVVGVILPALHIRREFPKKSATELRGSCVQPSFRTHVTSSVRHGRCRREQEEFMPSALSGREVKANARSCSRKPNATVLSILCPSLTRRRISLKCFPL
jgi:hypothetical protein